MDDGWDIASALRHLATAAEAGLADYGQAVAQQLRENLSRPSPSAPGHFPGAVDGILAASIHRQVQRDGEDVVLTVYTDDTPAKVLALEFGTRTMAPRPFMTPTLQVMARDGVADTARHIHAHWEEHHA